ncbi:unnamed protein product [Prunus armeniaca]|uniref:Uncharacterized protein n=1 Tax=Prunus armeniaca TaxID=36596 RepID=A0A6J5V092_PRUAR|nr:unnamed protein product [Prunus armeniaca]CAB4311882.1 unnamed protein product [Prunus armeniaca]
MAQLFSLLSPLYPLPSLNRVIRKVFIQTVVLGQPAGAGAGGIQCGTTMLALEKQYLKEEVKNAPYVSLLLSFSPVRTAIPLSPPPLQQEKSYGSGIDFLIMDF